MAVLQRHQSQTSRSVSVAYKYLITCTPRPSPVGCRLGDLHPFQHDPCSVRLEKEIWLTANVTHSPSTGRAARGPNAHTSAKATPPSFVYPHLEALQLPQPMRYVNLRLPRHSDAGFHHCAAVSRHGRRRYCRESTPLLCTTRT